jgi:hypothetical protein
MKKKKHKHKPQRFFVQLFNDTMDAPAWRQMSMGARLLFVALKRRYNRKTQGAVFLSVRTAAGELNASKDSITGYYRELAHFGFVTCTNPAQIGIGKGKAARYRLADEPYQGSPPSMEFTFWNGVRPSENFGRTVLKIRTHRPKISDGAKNRPLKKPIKLGVH